MISEILCFHSTCQTILQVELVIVLLIDKSLSTHPSLLRLTIELWKALPSLDPLQMSLQREAHNVWSDDWTLCATPLYILLVDIFRGQVPVAYGDNNCVHLDTVAWRQDIIDMYSLL